METAASATIYPFLQGGGEMGELTRNFDWTKTPLGNPLHWPLSLRTSVSILLNSQFPMFVWWGKELTTIYNDSYRVIAGEKHPELLGKSGRIGWSEIWQDLTPLVDKVFKGVSTWSEDMLLFIERHGFIEETYFTFSYSPVINESGDVGGLFCACIETTEKVLGRKRLKESESRFRTLVEQAPVPIGLTRGREMYFEVINAHMLGLIGRTGNVLQRRLEDVMPELMEQPVVDILRTVWDTGQPYTGYEVPATFFVNEELADRYFDLSYTPVFENGRINSIIHVAVDVTAQVLARQNIERSEQRFQNLVREASVGIVVLTGEAMVVSVVNAAYARLIGRTVEELLNQPLFDIIPDARPTFQSTLDQVRLTGESLFMYDTPYLVYSKGQKIEGYINVVYQPYREADGTITGVMALVQEVTEQVAARQKLLEADETARLSIEAGELGTVEVNLQTNEIFVSKRTEEIFEIDPGSDRSSYISRIHPDDLACRAKAYEKASSDGQLEYEARVIRKDGSIRWIRAKGLVFFDESKSPLKLVSVIQDVTKEKNFAQELQKEVSERTRELQRSNKELQQFAHVASHDLKEPARKIKVFANLLAKELNDELSGSGKFYLSKIESAATRIDTMIEGVLHYSSFNASPKMTEQVDLNTIFKQIQEDLEILINQKNAEIEIGGLPVIEGASVLLYQLFYNLINNSLKFTRPDTIPLIKVYAETADLITNDEKPFVSIRVADNGIGFEQKNAESIFETFTRLHSKDKFEGTGLGLTLCKKIVERHGGTIVAEATEGAGATFTIRLPINQS